MRKRWQDLSPRTKKLIVAGAVVDTTLKVFAVRDLVHRDAAEIRGSKTLWAVSLVLVNSMGALPVTYFLAGRQEV